MNKMIRKAIISALMIMVFAFSIIKVQAHEAVDMTRNDCTLTVTMKYDGKPVSGGNLILYRVGDVVSDGADFIFKWKDDLNCTAGMEDLESEETAGQVLSCVKACGMEGQSVQVNGNGEAIFKDLEVGLYLAWQKDAAQGYTAMKPFLISLPRWEDDRYAYDVTAAAKSELQKEPTTPETPPETPGPRLPYTGQLKWPVPVLAGLGAVLVITGIIVRKRKRNDA